MYSEPPVSAYVKDELWPTVKTYLRQTTLAFLVRLTALYIALPEEAPPLSQKLTASKWSSKPAPEEPRKHLLGTHLIITKHATPTESASRRRSASTEAATATTEGVLGLRAGALEAGLGVGAVAVVAVALVLVAEDGEGLGDHLEGLVGTLVGIFVRVRQQALLAVGLLDVRVRARRSHRVEI